MIKVLVCDQFSLQALEALTKSSFQVQHAKNLCPSEQELKDCEVLLIRSRSIINQQLLAKAKSLKLIVSATAGFDHIDFKLCRQKKITVMHTPKANTQSAAELTIALMLSHLRSLPLAQKLVTQQKWRDELTRGQTLHHKKVGIVGLGKIGLKVAEFCKAFGADVSFFDPYVNDHHFTKTQSLQELLQSNEILSLHVPLTKKTHHLINKSTLELMPKRALLINCSRGPVIHQSELFKFLKKNSAFKVALDVYEKEPFKTSDSIPLQQMFLTPHIGAFTAEAFEWAGHEAVEKINAFYKNGQIHDPVPPDAAWVQDL